ncbi:hypothetical protein [Kitasatospora herbaricolor]
MISDDASRRLEGLLPAAGAVLTGTDWGVHGHACTGMQGVPDTPEILLGLLDDDVDRRVRAVRELYGLVLHQDTIYGATAPAARYVAAILDDPRTRAEAQWERGVGTGPLRAKLLDWLGRFAETAAYPPHDGPGQDEDIVASQAARLAVHADVAAFFDDPDPRVREAALAAAAPLMADPELAHHIPHLVRALRALVCAVDPRHRQIARDCLQAWDEEAGELLAEDEALLRAQAEADAASWVEDPWQDVLTTSDTPVWLVERPKDTAHRSAAATVGGIGDPARPDGLLGLLGVDEEVVAFFAGVADLDATSPADYGLEDGLRLASGARLEQFARAGSGDAFCFVGEGGEERPVVYVSLDGQAGPLALGLPELVELCLVAPWWREAQGRTGEELRAVAEEYREDLPDLDERRERAARVLGFDPTALPSEAAVLVRLARLSHGPVAAACLVLGYEGDPLDPLFDASRS